MNQGQIEQVVASLVSMGIKCPIDTVDGNPENYDGQCVFFRPWDGELRAVQVHSDGTFEAYSCDYDREAYGDTADEAIRRLLSERF